MLSLAVSSSDEALILSLAVFSLDEALVLPFVASSSLVAEPVVVSFPEIAAIASEPSVDDKSTTTSF